MSHYSHLTLEERYQISALLKTNISVVQIARILNKDRSTIYREINRNKGHRGYKPKQAHRLSTERRARNQSRLTDFFWTYVEHLIQQYYSPEQISGRLILLGWEDVGSAEAIYLYIYRDKGKGGNLHTFLRCQKKYRVRNFKTRDRRGKIKNQKNISERPDEADKRLRYGDFEGDCIVGKDHRGVILTYVERKHRLTKMKGLPNRKAELVTAMTINLLKGLGVLTITDDNGKEFSGHEEVREILGADVYFATPYHSWERGTNENTNGLIRQFFPKDIPLDNLDDEYVQKIEDLLNNRPRKVLGYLTPFESLAQEALVALHI